MGLRNDDPPRYRVTGWRVIWFVAAGLAIPGISAAETRSFAISSLTQAVWSQEGDCPGGIEPPIGEMYRRALIRLGKTPKEAEALMADFQGGEYSSPVHDLMVDRGRIDGKPVDIYDNPTAAPDPGVHTVVGQFAPGFNLDGKGAESPNGFEDPETHEKGINNEYFRAMGCFSSHRAMPPARPLQWSGSWDSQRFAMRAWLISITGDDLGKDGDVTVTFDRALRPLMADANGNVQRDETFRIDSDPRSHNIFHGTIKDGVIGITPGDFHIMGDPVVIPRWLIHNTHLRLRLSPDGTLSGLIGGYQPWRQLYFFYAQGSYSYEAMAGLDMSGIYYVLRRLADAEPDPATGQNMAISVAYRIEAVPALILPPEDLRTTAANQ
jgi:hypothetical protein